MAIAICLMSCIKEKQTGADLGVGDRVPDFAVEMNDGTVTTGKMLSDGISVIVFFTTGCPDCRETLPHVQRLYDEYEPRGVSFALISREEGVEKVSEYWSSNGFSMPYSAQSDRKIYELFASTQVPRIYINKDGLIVAIFTDLPETPSYNDLESALSQIL